MFAIQRFREMFGYQEELTFFSCDRDGRTARQDV